VKTLGTFLFLLILLSGRAFAATLDVSIVIDAQARDSAGHGILSEDDQLIAEHLKKGNPDSEIHVIRGGSNEEIRQALAQLTMRLQGRDSNYRISEIYISSHGATVDWNKLPEDERKFKSETDGLPAALILSETGAFRVILNSAGSVQDVFGPILEKLSDHARIIIGACDTIQISDASVRLAVMKKVAHDFGLREGSLYMSRGDDTNMEDFLLKECWRDLPDQTPSEQAIKTYAFVAQLFPFLTRPVILFGSRVMANRGDLLRVHDGRFDFSSSSKYRVMESTGP